MNPDVPQLKCRKCRAPIHWETLGGMRVMAMKARGTKPVYRTRCGCGGEVKRDGAGRRVK